MSRQRPPIVSHAGQLLAGLALCAVAACAHTPPQELRDAQTAYARASAGPAATVAPAELLKARQALTRAERAFDDDPGSARTRDLSYVAHRRALLADAIARTTVAEGRKAQAESDRARVTAAQLTAAREKLDQAHDALAESQRQKEAERATAQDLVDGERAAREDAEARALSSRAAPEKVGR